MQWRSLKSNALSGLLRSLNRPVNLVCLVILMMGISERVFAACPPPISWSRTHNSPASDTDEAKAVAHYPTGEVVVVGFEARPDVSEGRNWMIRKYDATGILLWSRTYNSGPGMTTDEANGVAVDTNGDIVVVGHGDNDSTGGISYNWLIRKYNSAGNLIWHFDGSTPFAGSQSEIHDVTTDSSDNIYVTGRWANEWRTQKFDAWANPLLDLTYDSADPFASLREHQIRMADPSD